MAFCSKLHCYLGANMLSSQEQKNVPCANGRPGIHGSCITGPLQNIDDLEHLGNPSVSHLNLFICLQHVPFNLRCVQAHSHLGT